MGILIASKALNTFDNERLADFISNEFKCKVSEEDVALFKCSIFSEDYDKEGRRIEYYGYDLFDDWCISY